MMKNRQDIESYDSKINIQNFDINISNNTNNNSILVIRKYLIQLEFL